jgi:hypothetical protein
MNTEEFFQRGGIRNLKIIPLCAQAGIGHRFDHHAINDVAISTKPVETG